jgi:hypothetical protein
MMSEKINWSSVGIYGLEENDVAGKVIDQRGQCLEQNT